MHSNNNDSRLKSVRYNSNCHYIKHHIQQLWHYYNKFTRNQSQNNWPDSEYSAVKKAKNISKQTIRAIKDLAIFYKESNNWGFKKQAYPNKKYFNCHKLGYYNYDYPYANK